MGNLKTFQYKGKTYEMKSNPKGTPIGRVCQECPLQKSCTDFNETGTLIDLKGGFCNVLEAHPVLVENPVQERTILLKKTGPFRNSYEEDDWREVLTIANSWGWIQD